MCCAGSRSVGVWRAPQQLSAIWPLSRALGSLSRTARSLSALQVSLCLVHVRGVYLGLLMMSHDERRENRTSSRVGRGLFVWIAFAKVGSTTLRYHLRARALQHGWPTWPKPQAICTENFIHALRPQRLRCQALPDGYVIASPRVGYCERLKSRPCHYITLLREPKARMYSAYQYYCRGCAEGTCQHVASPTAVEPACPNISLIEYAQREGNRYSLVLGGGGALRPRVTPSMRNENREDQVEELFRSAIHRLSRSAPTSMLVLLTERLATGDLDELAYYLGDADRPLVGNQEGGNWTGARAGSGRDRDSRHAHMHRTPRTRLIETDARASSTSSDVRSMAIGAMSKEEDAALGEILRYDIALYQHARDILRGYWPPFRIH